MFNKLISDINTIIKYGIRQPVKFQLVDCIKNEFFIASLNLYFFYPVQKTRDELQFYRLPDATFYDCINTIYQFIKAFFEKLSIFLGIWSLLMIEYVEMKYTAQEP